MAKVNLQEMFVVRMERLIFDLNDTDKATPLEAVGSEWWQEMIEIRSAAYEAVRKFKTEQTKPA